ncbi:MAG TPA: hypothetical protein VG963_26915 [Polyangiaceae bacterium]|nr:hypothetical protein [Polyangiaceae bacterium]
MKWQRAEEAARASERRQREAEAPRLARLFPTLQSLQLQIEEHSSNISRPESTHKRHVVVASAPALFVLPCHDSQCKGGGHDITEQVLAALRARAGRFTAEDACLGAVGMGQCSRVLHFVGIAAYGI